MIFSSGIWLDIEVHTGVKSLHDRAQSLVFCNYSILSLSRVKCKSQLLAWEAVHSNEQAHKPPQPSVVKLVNSVQDTCEENYSLRCRKSEPK